MQPIYRIQKVIEPRRKAKITIPKIIQEKWGFPEYVLVIYNEKEDKLEIKPYKGA